MRKTIKIRLPVKPKKVKRVVKVVKVRLPKTRIRKRAVRRKGIWTGIKKVASKVHSFAKSNSLYSRAARAAQPYASAYHPTLGKVVGQVGNFLEARNLGKRGMIKPRGRARRGIANGYIG